MTPEEWFDLIEQRGPGLAAAGVRVFKMGDVEVHLAPQIPDLPAVTDAPAASDHANPLDDPALYPNGIVPGYELLPEDKP